MVTFAEQIRAAMKNRKWTVEHLLVASGLECSRSSLNRKLRGKQPLDPAEIQALVNALDIAVAVVPEDS